jgi:hypothetical protein
VVALVSSFSSTCLALEANKMAGVMENYAKFEFRAVVRLLQAEGASQSDSS